MSVRDHRRKPQSLLPHPVLHPGPTILLNLPLETALPKTHMGRHLDTYHGVSNILDEHLTGAHLSTCNYGRKIYLARILSTRGK